MPEKTVTLRNETGLHARPARVFSKAAAEYDADITVAKVGSGEDPVNAKSVLSVLTLDCHKDDEITISAEGEDADAALDRLTTLIDEGLGE